MSKPAPRPTNVLLEAIRNPILRGFNPDPAICRSGNDYYIATSTFEWYPGVQIHHSTDLRNWQLVSRPLDEARLLDLTGVPDSGGVWAPCLSYADGRFWLCYTIVRRLDGDFKDTHNYLTNATSIDGNWSDPEFMNSSGFDPSLFHDDDGRKWHVNMIWDHRADKNRFAGIALQEYSALEKRLVGPVKNIFRGSPRALTEAPHIYKRKGIYYLMTAEGGTGSEHAVTLARSQTIDGPYELDPKQHVMTASDRPEATLQRTGHASLVDTPDGDWYMAHLCGRPLGPDLRRGPMGRESALQRVHWDEDGWLRLSDPDTAYDAAGEFELADCHYDFEDSTLPDDFQWLRLPTPSRLFSLTAKPGYLRLFGRESVGSLYETALVARRQQHFNYEAETKIEFAPTNFQQMAGIIAWYNSHKFHYLHVTHDEYIGRQLSLMSCQGDQSLALTYPETAIVALPSDGPVWLRCTVKMTELQFSYSLDNDCWTKVGPALDASILSDEAGKTEHGNFTGAFVGMACQDITGTALPADFEYFSYRETQ
jgi:xylan 1,4-beta-xylosidase